MEGKYTGYIARYLGEMTTIVALLGQFQAENIEKMIEILVKVKARGGRVFFIGVGGGAGTSSHAKNDFMKIAGIEANCLTDNPSLFSALMNDEGPDAIFTRELEMYKLKKRDCIFIFSVGGGSDTTSKCITNAIIKAKECGAAILGVVGSLDGYTAKLGDAVVVIPRVSDDMDEPVRVTAHSEDFMMFVNHLVANAIANDGKP